MPKNDLSFPSRISSMTSINQQKQRQQQQQLAPASIRSNEVVVHMESPTIKYQFVNLLNNLYGKWVNANVAGHGNRSSQPTPATTPTDLTDLVPSPKTTTTTLASMTASTSQHDEITEIDMDEKETHCRTFDNEPNALEQIKTFNLNVKVQQEDEEEEEEEQRLKEKEALAKGVGEQKMEIEHQQAENFNDAFGRQQRHDDDHCYDYSVDAMDVAKNKHELYEQSKLERNQQKESRDELNMNKAASKILANEEHNEWTPRECQRQRVESICLASNREQTIDEYGTASNHQLLAVDLSDTRETSSEQVDEQQQQLRHHHHHHRQQHQQHQHQQYQPHVKSNGSIVTRPNIEIFKSAVHAFLAAGECACSFPLARKEFDLELIDFLSDIIEVLFSSVGAVGQTKQVATSCECADMTVSKVSEEQDSEAAAIVVAAAVGDVYPDQIDSPSEVEDNNNNNISSNNIIKIRNDNQQIDNMKYELKPTVATTTTLPLASSNRHATSVHPSTLEASPTSRIRNNLETPATAVRSTPLLLGDLKRSSSSRDDLSESVLPERTRLRRQRRMRSQDSVEEKPEDVIERLNKLKARISGALSEVKGVLKQYSTESESETTTQPAIVKATDTATATSSSAAASAAASAAPVPPAVAFRFVKKVRRRSCFDEAEEEQESESNQSAPPHEKKQEEKDKDEHEKEEQKTKLSAVDTVKVNLNEEKLNTEQNSAEKLKGLAAENDTNETQKQSDVPTTSAPPPTTAVPGHVSPTPPTTAISVQTKIDFLKKVRSELKGKPANEENKTTETPTAATEAPSTTTTTTTTTMPTPLPSESITLDSTVADVAPAREKIKKKIIVKAKNPRRASIAAVEPSKIQIEPLVAQTDALHTQRRPSDSEAIVKRKKEKLMGARATPTTTISSGIAKETTNIRQQPKQQQKPATTTTPTNEQLSTPKVNNADAIPAKIKTKSLAKSDKGDEAATVSIPANTGVTDKSTPAASTTEGGGGAAAATTQPEQINIDGVDTNQVQTTDRTSHNHTEKVAELVIAEPPVVVVVVVPPPAGSSNNAGEDTTSHISSSPVISSSLSESKKPINQSDASSFEAPPTPDHLVAIAGDIEDAAAAAEKSAPPQIAATLSEVSHEESSLQQQSPQQQQQQSESVADTKDKTHTDTSDSLAAMPELKVLSGPVQPVKIETVVDQANDETKNGNQQQISVTKKKTPHLKKLVRKNSIDKDKDKDKEKEKEKDEQTNNDDKLKNILRNKNKITELSSRLNKLTPPKKIAKPSQEGQQQVVTIVKEQKENGESEINAEVIDDDQQTGTEVEDELSPLTEPEPKPEPQPEPIPAPKQRKIKKKVIIKRQKRRLSISDSFFIQPETEEPKVPEIETIEKAIAYVTDDEVDNQEPDEADTAKPLKSCLHVREYKIGDLVLYAERYRKTQVRWKRGRVLERITSISYKLEIEGKEVAAHISYIKKYTGRKVRFGGKEYLEIDYEQVAEEERRARSYSIWNMV